MYTVQFGRELVFPGICVSMTIVKERAIVDASMTEHDRLVIYLCNDKKLALAIANDDNFFKLFGKGKQFMLSCLASHQLV